MSVLTSAPHDPPAVPAGLEPPPVQAPPAGARMIPINLEDEHERDILHKQREICGWNKEKIPQWREQMAKGERTLFWVTLPKDYRPPEGGGGGGGGGSRAGINDLRRPLDGFGRPDEDTAAPTTTTSLEDLATLPRIRRARRRTSHGEGEEEQQQEEEEERLPVGHVSLDRVDRGEDGTEPDTSLASGDGRVLTLTALFVLPAFKALRLGAFAMDECEAMAQQSPYGNPNCEAITVHTMSPRHLAGGAEQGHWAKLGLQVPKRDNSVWYKRRGYVQYKEAVRFHVKSLEGEEIEWYVVFMRKELGGEGLGGDSGYTTGS